MKDCIDNIKVGDLVRVDLLHYDQRYAVLGEITFPVIGLDENNVPIIGSSSRWHYENHHFISVNPFYDRIPSCRKWIYCMSLNVQHIRITKVIKGTPPPEWRVGKTLGRPLYLNDKCIGMVDTPELAKLIVDALNAK